MNAFHNMSMPPRTTLVLKQTPVAGRKSIFNLCWACWAGGLLRDGKPPEDMRAMNSAAADRKWNGSLELFLQDLRGLGGEAPAAGAPPGYLIGMPRQGYHVLLGADTGICPDPVLTVHVLARLVGGLYIPHRPPRMEWEQLFGDSYLVDDPSLTFPSCAEPPWNVLLKEAAA